MNAPESRRKFVCLLLQMMPQHYYKIAELVFKLLHSVTLHASENLMNADNLGSIFAPHMLCSKQVGIMLL